MQKADRLMFSSESSTASPLDGSLKDITDVAPCRKRRFRYLRPPEAAEKKPTPEGSQRKRYATKSPRNVIRSCHVECLCCSLF